MTKYLEVTGTGCVSQPADEVRIQLHLIAQDLDYAQALKESQAQLADFMSQVTELGLTKEQIRTSDYQLNAHYEQDPNSQIYRTIFQGYRINHSLEIKTAPGETLTKLLELLPSLRGKPEFYLSFGLSEPAKYQNLARERAIEQAKAMAKHLAEVSHVTLGGILQLEVSQGFAGGPVAQDYRMKAEVSFPIGQNEICQTVKIRFAID